MANRYLEGNFAPVREELTVTELEVTGTIPDHLDGRYLRNGPNPVADPDPATHHWFFGAGMVHGVRIRDGAAEWYRNRWVRSAEVAAALGEQPREGPVYAGFDVAPNTHVIGHAGRIFAITEPGRPYELTDELDTVGPCDFDGTLPGVYVSHPHVDPATGELHAVAYFFGWGKQVQYLVLGVDGRIRRRVDIAVAGSPMMHDFSLTEGHVVLYDLPVTFDVKTASGALPRLLAGPARILMSQFIGRRRIPEPLITAIARRGGGPVFPYKWNPDHPARVGVMPRDGDGFDVRWFEVEPCYVFHPLNAFDNGDQIVLDVIRHPKMFATDRLDEGSPKLEGTPTLDRWTVDLTASKVIEERLDDRGQEFPRVDDRVVGRRHRYGYTVGTTTRPDGSPELPLTTVLKHDLVSQQTLVRTFGQGCAVDEFVFVPNGAHAAEDDGILMGFVYHPDRDHSDLVLLDAETLDPVAAVHLPVRVPHGFHGSWVPAAA